MGILKKWKRFQKKRRGQSGALPDFLIIGAQKAGTTSLYDYLVRHPLIQSATTKEVHYFDRAPNFQKGLNWYRSHFPNASFKNQTRNGVAPITGEATPQYLFFPHAPRRIKEVVPDAKFIVLLRNPIDRAYSHFNQRIRNNHETLSFEDALAAEEGRMQPELEKILADENYYSWDFQHFSYKLRGHYAEQLERWFEYFPREQFLVLSSEDFFKNTQRIYDEVLSFLGMPPHELENIAPLHSAQSHGASYEEMKPETRAMLHEYFAPHNARLYQLLGHDFGWD